jgi:arylsulfatase A-like enzyme
MHKYLLSLSLLSLAAILICPTSVAQPPTRSGLPNVVVFLADDQGYGDFSIIGNTNLRTPNIDRLAADGALLTHFYVSPVCSPTRAEFLTGRYHLRMGVTSTSEGKERFNLGETTIAEVFKQAGYATAAFGKWHNGMQYPYHPNGRGFDEFYGFASGHWGNYFSPTLEHNGQLVRGDGFIPDDLTNQAMAFIEKNKARPFFLYIPYNTPHSPMQVPDLYWDRFQDKALLKRGTEPEKENIEHTRAALAMCENIDWNVGRVLEKLKASGLERNTIVLYFNDNGPNGNRWRDGLKGQKGSTDEGGVRSPLFIKWPGIIPAGKRISEISGAIDLLPTLADLAGIAATSNHPRDGISLKSLILEGKPGREDRVIFSHWNGRISARSQQYRFSHNGELYDMLADPGQIHDLAKEKPELAANFKRRVEAWKSDVSGQPGDKKRNFPVGHPDFKFTQLPARDGEAHGGIQRSNRFPNSSFFTNWNSVSGKITWPIEVVEDGVFEVEIYYTCPRGEEGSEIKLSFGNSSLVAKITEAHDPPLIGMENDRVKRMESYEKDFKPLKAGVMKLKKGEGELTLQAVSMPGAAVMDFRLLMLTRIEAR